MSKFKPNVSSKKTYTEAEFITKVVELICDPDKICETTGEFREKMEKLINDKAKAELKQAKLEVLNAIESKLSILRGIDRFCEGWNGHNREVRRIIAELKQQIESE